jgi:uncharacterized membrane protein YfcA
MIPEFWWFVGAGFAAQLIDGALGMAYGVTASSLLLALGVPPAVGSATVHAAECFTTGVSGMSHHAFDNIDRGLFRRLVLPGVVGAILGAYILTSFPGDALKPFVAAYLLLMGILIVRKAFAGAVQPRAASRVGLLGFFGGLLDSMGGGGWGPVVTGTLVARGGEVRTTVGSVNASEFFVTVAASVTFFLTIGLGNWQMIAALALGGLPAAPLAAWACRRLPLRPLMTGVGVLVIATSTRTLLSYFRAI